MAEVSLGMRPRLSGTMTSFGVEERSSMTEASMSVVTVGASVGAGGRAGAVVGEAATLVDEIAVSWDLAVGGLAPLRIGIREGALTFFGETVLEVLSRI